MTPQVLGNFLVSILENIIYLTSAQILLSKELREISQSIIKILIFAITEGIYDSLTYGFLSDYNLNSIRIILNILLYFILIKIIFKNTWWETIKLNILFWFFGLLSQTLISFILIYLFKISLPQMMNENLPILFKVFLPLESLTVLVSIILRKFKTVVLDLLPNIKVFKNSSLINSVSFAIIAQLILLASLMADYMDNLTYRVAPLRFAFTVLINIGVILLSIFILLKTVQKTEQKVVEASSMAISENIFSLLNSVRSQRHDFVNHIQIIYSLFHSHDTDGLNTYLKQLTDDITVLNNVLKVDNPFIGALLNSKIAKAELKGIELHVDINAQLSSLSAKAFDLTRILDNLINNALEYIEQHNTNDKWVNVAIKEHGPFLTVAVKNPGSPPAEVAAKLFEPGYTTKGGEHGGLGLHICKQLSKKLHGKLELQIVPGVETIFSLIIPR